MDRAIKVAVLWKNRPLKMVCSIAEDIPDLIHCTTINIASDQVEMNGLVN